LLGQPVTLRYLRIMTDSLSSLGEFLTVEEVAEVDRALLTAQDKFLARVSLYSLRSLKRIAEQEKLPIDAVTDQQIAEWVVQDDTVQQLFASDASFQEFFTRIVLSSLKPLRQIAREADCDIADLSVTQVIQWFEKEAKIRLEQGSEATFLGH